MRARARRAGGPVTVWPRRTRHGSPTSCAPLGSGRAPGEAHSGPVVPERPGRTVSGVRHWSAHRVAQAEAGGWRRRSGPLRDGTTRTSRCSEARHPHLGCSRGLRRCGEGPVGPRSVSVGTHRVAGARESAPENEMERLSSVVREFFRPRAHGVPDERRSWSSTSGIRMRCSLLRVVDGPGLRRRRRKRCLTEVCRAFSSDIRMRLRESAIKTIFYRSVSSVPAFRSAGRTPGERMCRAERADVA